MSQSTLLRQLLTDFSGRPWTYRPSRGSRIPLFKYVCCLYCEARSDLFSIDFDDPSSNRTANKITPDTAAASGANPFLRTSSSSSNQQKRIFLSLQYYTQFFDVDTQEVVKRCIAAIYPRANFLDVLEGNPDLYGPFWIATTVVFILFLAGTISWKLAQQGQEHFGYDFGLLSGAAGLIYGYTGKLQNAIGLKIRHLQIGNTLGSRPDTK